MGEEIFVVSNEYNRGKDIYPRAPLFQVIRGRDGAICFHSVASALLTCYQVFKRRLSAIQPYEIHWVAKRRRKWRWHIYFQLLKFLVVLDSNSRLRDMPNKSESDGHKKQHSWGREELSTVSLASELNGVFQKRRKKITLSCSLRGQK